MALSGEQIEIALGAERLVVATVGATLRSYTVGDRAVLDGFEADEICPDGRGQILMPWPNRIADGRYSFSGHVHQLPIDEPELGHAIHGLVRWADWSVERRAAEFVRLRHRLEPRPGYPFPLDLSVEYRLSVGGLGVTFTALNIGPKPCPFGAGAHPYFRFTEASVDAIELCVRAADWLDVDPRSIPRKERPVEHSVVDFHQPRPIGTARLDHAFTRLERDGAGLATVVLRCGRSEILVWQDRAFDFVQLYTGDTLPNRSRRRDGLAVEPMTCAPNAFNSGNGLRVLAPGEVFEGRWGIAVSTRSGRRSGHGS
ncbi:putative aldose-1-epimerase [Labilithrix luteola]|uniref:Putative aldose-1-epimerase n=1 Tax=Labilithrix luteola TaxID=1391654 RepID=A0A0K1Q3G9_9BACT|nr:aldose 1-epimerase family protein [Labilithrix luteola]AKV00177.1 putative aldose-1-epimerase [Labilithrix luteola]